MRQECNGKDACNEKEKTNQKDLIEVFFQEWFCRVPEGADKPCNDKKSRTAAYRRRDDESWECYVEDSRGNRKDFVGDWSKCGAITSRYISAEAP